MIRIIADAAVQKTLEGITETIELRGDHGELLGFFSPAAPETARLYAEAAASLVRDDIKQRGSVKHTTYSTAEVLESLLDASHHSGSTRLSGMRKAWTIWRESGSLRIISRQ